MAVIIDGKALARQIQGAIKSEVEQLKKAGITPGLAVIMVGEDAASQTYVRNKKKKCHETGINSFEHHLPSDTTEASIIGLIHQLNENVDIDGILIQLPLPPHINGRRVIESISPEKDVDGFHPYNIGRLLTGGETFVPCTPLGVITMIDSLKFPLSGKDVVIIGRSNIVGRPMAILLLQRDATVTICHSKTRDIEKKVKSADVVVSAIGKPEFVKGSWIKDGAIVIDVGINHLSDGSIKGDVEFDTAKERASYISPVPGGVGPMTIAMLLHNTLLACKKRRGTRKDF